MMVVSSRDMVSLLRASVGVNTAVIDVHNDDDGGVANVQLK